LGFSIVNSGRTENTVYVEKMDANLRKYGDDINNINEYIGDEPLFSTYASAFEVQLDQFQPTGTDYIIHVLSDEARENYIKVLLEGQYKYVNTINCEESFWETWIRNANWFFYKEVYKYYTPKHYLDYSIIWEKSDTSNVIENKNIDINIEKISDSKYRITLLGEGEGIVDTYVSYQNGFKANRFSDLAIGRYINVNDITSSKLYDEAFNGYYIPTDREEYNIPITMIDGVGIVEMEIYPNTSSFLEVSKVEIGEVFKFPYEHKLEKLNE